MNRWTWLQLAQELLMRLLLLKRVRSEDKNSDD